MRRTRKLLIPCDKDIELLNITRIDGDINLSYMREGIRTLLLVISSAKSLLIYIFIPSPTWV